ncbi:MAG: hypothetical protein NZ551_05590 [Microscillaceae bacterium]|nr:hypothetical protein [Microscillaceae bacterium]MDW8460669.1 hypothetical protein [Cytophagales bacterium]
MKLRRYYYFLFSILTLYLISCNKTNQNNDARKSVVKIQKPTFQKAFIGYVDHPDTLIHLNLSRYDTLLTGSYWYKIKGDDNKVQGKIDKKGNFLLIQKDSTGKPIVEIKGIFLSNINVLRGDWIDKKTNKIIPFEFQEPADTSFRIKNTIKITQKEIIRNNGNCLIDVVYPQISGYTDEVLQNKVNYYIESNFSLNQIRDLMNDLEACKKGFKGEIKYEIRCFKGDLLSISKIKHIDKTNLSNEIIDETFGIAINFKKGKIYEFQDLFNLEDIPRLNQVIQNRINSNCNNGLTSADLRKCEIKPNDVNCFCIGRDNITFHLTQKLPRAMRGCGYVRFRFNDLKEFINPSGPIAKLIELEKIEKELMNKKNKDDKYKEKELISKISAG